MTNPNEEQEQQVHETCINKMTDVLEPLIAYWPVILMLGAQVLAYALSYGFLKELFAQAHTHASVNVFERLGFILIFDVLLLIVWRFIPNRRK